MGSSNVKVIDPVSATQPSNSRVNLAGMNKMEILLFDLGGSERFGINVFKVKEVCHITKITKTPNMPCGVDGIVSLRGRVLPVLNLADFMGIPAQADPPKIMMVAEYSNHVLGFLVNGVDRIIRVDWDKVRATDGMLSERDSLITSITGMEDGALVSILDVEQILVNAFGEDVVGDVEPIDAGHELCVFFADDSSVARRKIIEVLNKMGVKYIQSNNGGDAWARLQSMASAAQSSGARLHDQIQVILTDAEMPEMDGYVLTQNIKSDRRFDGIPVVMHSSLSSEANRMMGHSAGVDAYVSKFDSHALSLALRPLLAS